MAGLPDPDNELPSFMKTDSFDQTSHYQPLKNFRHLIQVPEYDRMIFTMAVWSKFHTVDSLVYSWDIRNFLFS
jgi:hypothetical protein